MATPPSTDPTTVHALLLPGRSWYDYASYLNFPTNFIQSDVLLHLPLLDMENESFFSPTRCFKTLDRGRPRKEWNPEFPATAYENQNLVCRYVVSPAAKGALIREKKE